jgi:hypothetical protein
MPLHRDRSMKIEVIGLIGGFGGGSIGNGLKVLL